MKRRCSAAEIALNVVRGGIIIAIAATIICFFTSNTNRSTIVVDGISPDSLAAAAEIMPNAASGEAGAQDNSTPAANPAKTEILNINTATAEQLTSLKGIGETKAAAIVEYRQRHGSFTSKEELLNVSGIGEKTLENIIDLITV